MLKMGLGGQIAFIWIFIQLAGKPKTIVPFGFQNLPPLVGFQGNTVYTRKTR